MDLRDCYECAQPGLYQLQLRFTTENGGLADGTSHQIVFTLTKPES